MAGHWKGSWRLIPLLSEWLAHRSRYCVQLIDFLLHHDNVELRYYIKIDRDHLYILGTQALVANSAR